jgi:hypothetical protein
MYGINMKPAPAISVAAIKPALSASIWRDKLAAPPKSDRAAKLLQYAGLIGPQDYCDALEIAESLNKSIDQVIASSFLPAKLSELCKDAVSHLERGLINESLAADALRFAYAKGLTFLAALKYFGYGW